MTLIKLNDKEWVLVGDSARMNGSKDEVVGCLTKHIAGIYKHWHSFDENLAQNAAASEVDTAIRCMENKDHNMVEFGIFGHFLRTGCAEIKKTAAA